MTGWHSADAPVALAAVAMQSAKPTAVQLIPMWPSYHESMTLAFMFAALANQSINMTKTQFIAGIRKG
jgi:cytochrome c biogenesis protein CcdA